MKKIIYMIIFCVMLIPNIIFAKEKELNMYLFYGDGCPHCVRLEKYLNHYLKDKPNIKLYRYEVWHNEENRNSLKEVYKITGSKSGVPYLVIGNNVIIGFAENHTEEQITSTINYYLNMDYEDKVGKYLTLVNEKEELSKDKIDDINISNKLKNIIKNRSLIITSIIMGLINGFTTSSIWILIFLISILIGVKNRKRKWMLGTSFLLTTGVIYFTFLISKLNLSIFINSIAYIKLGISCAAVMLGFFSIIKFIKTRYTNDNKNKSLNKITIIKEKSFVLAIVGIILLAFAVNIIQLLLSSLELPAMFIQVLSINDISMKYTIIYPLIYVISFLLDDFLVLFISMKILEIKSISNKYGSFLQIISGIILMIIGFLILYKPQWIMLNF